MKPPLGPSRHAALAALEDFLPRVPEYASQRNFDRPGHREVSRLSPYLRRRIISEEEVIRRVLQGHPLERAEKFIQEVLWRTYWKGWLQANPHVWHQFLRDARSLESSSASSSWSDGYQAALSGSTRLSFFNDWCAELAATGYLHNHTRMWFASTWIFTLKLPWQLGALFMYRSLLDGDPASNTLSWRWVAGLHTRGKAYLAQPDNIQRYSEGRWCPKAGELAASTFPIDESRHGDSVTTPSREPAGGEVSDVAVIISADDLSLEAGLAGLQGLAACALVPPAFPLGESDSVRRFAADAVADARARIEEAVAPGAVTLLDSPDALPAWMALQPAQGFLLVLPTVGPDAALVEASLAASQRLGRPLVGRRRAWDTTLWPFATKGFFPFWERARALLEGNTGPFNSREPLL